MLLDLNVGIVSGESGREETRSEEDSPTSSSSVVSAEDARNNAADETLSSTNSSPLVFDVFKDRPASRLVNGKTPAPEFVTRQLFPVTGDGGGGESGSARTTQWLNLSFVDKNGPAEVGVLQAKQPARKSRRGPRSRSSQYRGVTFYRRTGRWESHIWDCGKQVYLGGFDTAHSAARAYDRAAIKFRGVDADINFTLSDYDEDMKQTQNLSKEEFVHVLRRHTTGLAKGGSKYRGTTMHKSGPWVARAGQFMGKRDGVGHFDHEGEVVVHTNLDLSLGMSLTSNGQKGNVKDLRFQYVAREMPTREGKMIDNTSLAPGFGGSLNGLPVASKHVRSSLYPGFYQTYEGRVKMETGTSPRQSSWAWQPMHNNSGASNTMPVYSSAASSGFASSGTSTIVSSAVPVHQQNNVVRHIYQHQHPMFTTAASSPRQSQS